MNEILEKESVVIENMIYEIRGKQVMLDSEILITKCHKNMKVKNQECQ